MNKELTEADASLQVSELAVSCLFQQLLQTLYKQAPSHAEQ